MVRATAPPQHSDRRVASRKRRYRDPSGLATALDVVGERWTLLIVRELLRGPRRYGELLGALDGIGTNLLVNRLRDLERAGVLRRQLARALGRGERAALERRHPQLEPRDPLLARVKDGQPVGLAVGGPAEDPAVGRLEAEYGDPGRRVHPLVHARKARGLPAQDEAQPGGRRLDCGRAPPVLTGG